MADASFIIEGQDGLVVMEYPLFKVNAKEFADYIAELGKKVVTDITDYHLTGPSIPGKSPSITTHIRLEDAGTLTTGVSAIPRALPF